jgi:hypothetical protein
MRSYHIASPASDFNSKDVAAAYALQIAQPSSMANQDQPPKLHAHLGAARHDHVAIGQ